MFERTCGFESHRPHSCESSPRREAPAFRPGPCLVWASATNSAFRQRTPSRRKLPPRRATSGRALRQAQRDPDAGDYVDQDDAANRSGTSSTSRCPCRYSGRTSNTWCLTATAAGLHADVQEDRNTRERRRAGLRRQVRRGRDGPRAEYGRRYGTRLGLRGQGPCPLAPDEDGQGPRCLHGVPRLVLSGVHESECSNPLRQTPAIIGRD